MLEKLRILLWIVAMVACAAFYVYYRRNAPRHGMDSINVYKMRFRGVPIFNRFRSFVRDMGLPETIKVKGETRPVS